MLLQIVAAITLGATALVGYYLWLVPEGPSCPRCGSGVRQVDEARRPGRSLRDRIGVLLKKWTDLGWCPVCDWKGRMRRGVRARPIPSDSNRGGGES